MIGDKMTYERIMCRALFSPDFRVVGVPLLDSAEMFLAAFMKIHHMFFDRSVIGGEACSSSVGVGSGI